MGSGCSPAWRCSRPSSRRGALPEGGIGRVTRAALALIGVRGLVAGRRPRLCDQACGRKRIRHPQPDRDRTGLVGLVTPRRTGLCRRAARRSASASRVSWSATDEQPGSSGNRTAGCWRRWRSSPSPSRSGSWGCSSSVRRPAWIWIPALLAFPLPPIAIGIAIIAVPPLRDRPTCQSNHLVRRGQRDAAGRLRRA